MPTSFLLMQRGDQIGEKFPLKQGKTTVGRNPDNDIVMDEVAVSRYHAFLQFDQQSGELTVMDLGSTNGVTVNNVEIKSGTPYQLNRRDTVFIGRAVLNVQIRPDDYQPLPPPDTLADDKDATKRLNLPPQPREGTRRFS